MHPILLRIDGIAIPSYGVMLVISFLFALWFTKKKAKQFGISPVVIENLAFYLMLGVIIGGRLLYVIFHWFQYSDDILGIFRIWEGGMMFFGGFIGGFIGGALYLRSMKISILHISDITAPALGLGLFFTRIGCFLNGCCFGLPTDLPWGVKFPASCAAGSSPVGGEHLHPTQLYSSIFGLALFFFLNRRLSRPHPRGEVFSLYLIFYGGFRFGVDFVRYYENSANYWINQVIALGLIGIGLIILLWSRKDKNRK